MLPTLPPDFFARPTLEVAPDLIGCFIRYRSCVARIVEVEAYSADAASHGFTRTRRSAIMHDTFGHVYVYRSYGVHFCMNFTTDRRKSGAILIRAAEPIEGIGQMKRRRGDVNEFQLCRGPGNLTAAFGISLDLNESMLGVKIIVLHGASSLIAQSTRIGISKAKELPWRFFDPTSKSVSGTSALNRHAHVFSLTGSSNRSE